MQAKKKVKARKRMSDLTTTSQRPSTKKNTLVTAAQADRVNLKTNGACLCRPLSDGCPGRNIVALIPNSTLTRPEGKAADLKQHTDKDEKR